jgi:V8-like Glu-specific endopeptidase
VILQSSKDKPSKDEIHPATKDLKFFISSSYRKKPSSTNAENDYGAIVVRKGSDRSPRGFGFALKLGHDDLYHENLNIGGYRLDTRPGKPVTSSGKCISCWDNQLEYEIQTEKGLSGSAVFTGYKGHDTVIAIQ